MVSSNYGLNAVPCEYQHNLLHHAITLVHATMEKGGGKLFPHHLERPNYEFLEKKLTQF